MPKTAQIAELLEQLHDPAARVRERAIRRLVRQGRHGFSVEDGLLVLKASSLPYPPRRDSSDGMAIELLRAALRVPFPEYLPAVVNRFPFWHSRVRREALNLLMRIDDRRAAEAVVAIVRAHARSGGVPNLPVGLYAHHPQHAEVFFPELLQYLDAAKLGFPIAALALTFASVQLLDAAILLPHAGEWLEIYRKRRDWLRPRQQESGIAWMWEANYHRRRWKAGVLLDLLGHVRTPAVEGELRQAVTEYGDPRLRMNALLSLLRHDCDVDPGPVAAIAESAECRKWLFDGLHKLERTHLFPKDQQTQAALAESDLANWLIHPTELGRPPDEIELMQTIPFDTETDAGWADYYLFRFRTDEPHWSSRYGWLAGVSGPFLRRDRPTIQALGDTFSAFTPWERKSEAEHADDVRELIKTWRERHVAKEE